MYMYVEECHKRRQWCQQLQSLSGNGEFGVVVIPNALSDLEEIKHSDLAMFNHSGIVTLEK